MLRNLFLLSALLCTSLSFAQNVGINASGTAGHPSAMLDVESTEKGLLVPRMTEAQRNDIDAPAEGLLVYQNDGDSGFYFYNGGEWELILGRSQGWSLEGNAGTDPAINFVGTSDAEDFAIRTNELNRLRFLSGGPGIFNGNVAFGGTVLNSFAFNTDRAIGAQTDGSGEVILGQNIGSGNAIRGLTTGTGIGVVGVSSGSGDGVVGLAVDNGVGVFAESNNSTGLVALSSSPGFAVEAVSLNASGTGIFTAGNNVIGSYLTAGSGAAFNGNRWGVFANATISGGSNNMQDRAAFIGSYTSQSNSQETVYLGARIDGEHYKVFGSGGGSVSTTMPTTTGERILFAPEAPENWFFDIGEVQLQNGEATVALDPIFVECISDSKPFKVFVQGSENTEGSIRIERDQEAKTFRVIDNGGESNGIVQFSIYAIWKGKENLRFPVYEKDHDIIEMEKVKAGSRNTKNFDSTRIDQLETPVMNSILQNER